MTEPIIPLVAPVSSTNIATVSTIPSTTLTTTTTTTTTTDTLSTEKEQQSKMQIDENPSETTSMSTLVTKTNNLSLDATITTQSLDPQPQLTPKSNDFEANLKGSFFRDFIVRNSPTTNVYSFLDKNKLTTKTFSCFGMLFFHYIFYYAYDLKIILIGSFPLSNRNDDDIVDESQEKTKISAQTTTTPEQDKTLALTLAQQNKKKIQNAENTKRKLALNTTFFKYTSKDQVCFYICF